MKQCSQCKLLKDFTFFSKDKRRSDNYRSCCSINNKKYKEENLEKIKSYQENWYQHNKEKTKLSNKQRYLKDPTRVKEYSKKWRAENSDQHRGMQLRYKYWPSSSWEEALLNYNKLFNDQNGLCACCTRHQSSFVKLFAVDHNHKTGKVRGLLCDPCNKGIGLLQDSTDVLYKAFNYLKTHNE